MSESNSTQSQPQTPVCSELLDQATALCNELDELMALHAFFYQAAEHYFRPSGPLLTRQRDPGQRGLSLFPAWLRERDSQALDTVYRIQDGLRAMKQQQLESAVS